MINLDYANLKLENNTVISIGNFDGFHKGHKTLVDECNKTANENKLKSLIMTFSPHPVSFFNKNDDFQLIMNYYEKSKIFEKQEIDFYLEHKFDKNFSGQSADDFIKNVLIEKLNCKYLILGDGASLGSEKSIDNIEEICKKYNISLKTISHLYYNNKRISSSRVRAFIRSGDIEEANYLLNENYFLLSNNYSHKNNNLIIEKDKIKLYPRNGHYLCTLEFNNKTIECLALINDNIQLIIDDTNHISGELNLTFNKKIK